MSKPRTRNVGILLFEAAELLDFAGPYEAFSSAGRYDDVEWFNTFTIGEQTGTITSNNGLPCAVEFTLEDAPKLDVLVVPGGRGTRTEVKNERLIAWIKSVAADAELVTSVCTGAFMLAEAGLLDGRRATTHWGSIERLRETYPNVIVEENVRFVDEWPIITSAGVSAGIDMALHAIEQLAGRDAAASSARLMEYEYWKPERVVAAD